MEALAPHAHALPAHHRSQPAPQVLDYRHTPGVAVTCVRAGSSRSISIMVVDEGSASSSQPARASTNRCEF